ncbi:HIG1 domain family member 2A, mitochondrial [Alligator mississippiensis]|uniref:HIG1 domain family member 2A, mitochondrial n=1 Tax=Alligator mississippiensis TaxID=8496 RepID=A0A151MZF2_ALLMI|nr:HIG1 domain family member 2A, mitochondrial [Alligator mississippiensis]KYO29936.1 HIG1 domain family member 2A, mitochondrial [Alligator mississippiensis]
MDPGRPPVIEGFEPSAAHHQERFSDKFKRKMRENPLVPIGCLGTLGALTYGLVCFKKGDRQQSQLMMRARILAQGFTIAALMVGVVVTALKPGRGGQAVGTGTAPAAANTPP